MNCDHKNFKAAAAINRSENADKTVEIPVRFFLKLTVECVDCGKMFGIRGEPFAGNNLEIVPNP